MDEVRRMDIGDHLHLLKMGKTCNPSNLTREEKDVKKNDDDVEWKGV